MADLSQITLPNGATYNFKDNRISATDISNWNNNGINITMSSTQPSSPNTGDVWFVEFEEQETLLEPL